MQRIPTAIPAVTLVVPPRFGDSRGFFAETFRSEWFPEIEFVQDNHSYSTQAGTIRGLHFQLPPDQQAKLVRVARGRVYDVAVDVREGSPSFLRHVRVELTADGGEQLLVPAGFAHGFVTLEPDTVVLYKVDRYFAPSSEGGIAWNDPSLRIDWGWSGDPVLSDRDRRLPHLDPSRPPFRHRGA